MSTLPETFAAAVRHQRAGNLREAERLLLEILRIDPRHTDALNRLGGIAATAGALDAAIDFFQRACALQPLEPQFHRNLGTALKSAGRVAEAIDHYRRAVQLDPSSVLGQVNLGEALMEQGAFDEAIAHNREALRLDPQAALAYCNLGELAVQGRYTFLDEEYAALQALAARADLPAADASLIHFTLAALLDRQGDSERAFHHYQKGNELKLAVYRADGQEFDSVRHRQLMDAVVATFTRDYFERVRGFGSDSEVPVFVIGMVRSGTTLVEQILASHPQIRGAGELRDMEQIAQALPQRLGTSERFPACLSKLDAATTRFFSDIYLRRLCATAGGAARIVDKMPHNFVYLGLIATLFPRARIINCRRDPLDLGAAIYFQNFKWMPYTATFEDIAYFYGQYERLLAHWRQQLPTPIHDVSYEDMVRDLEGESRRLIAFCGLPWNERCLAFHETARPVQTASRLQVRRPIYASAIGRWRPYAVQLKPLLDMLSASS